MGQPCPICDVNYSKATIYSHLASKHERHFDDWWRLGQCFLCRNPASSPFHLPSHWAEVHNLKLVKNTLPSGLYHKFFITIHDATEPVSCRRLLSACLAVICILSRPPPCRPAKRARRRSLSSGPSRLRRHPPPRLLRPPPTAPMTRCLRAPAVPTAAFASPTRTFCAPISPSPGIASPAPNSPVTRASWTGERLPLLPRPVPLPAPPSLAAWR